MKKEVATDLWVHDLLKEAEIELDAQGSSIKEIDDALKTASCTKSTRTILIARIRGSCKGFYFGSGGQGEP